MLLAYVRSPGEMARILRGTAPSLSSSHYYDPDTVARAKYFALVFCRLRAHAFRYNSVRFILEGFESYGVHAETQAHAFRYNSVRFILEGFESYDDYAETQGSPGRVCVERDE
ncbi:hypothetical protein ENH_00028320 [Eimeria necatrix]|uniref:Uncharacterized protein n=1 Tax=Eimeria necatrix TaxID=51315 RepID=U6MS00_9EIME|nr:hypothetical protein ENH_00028320 [Eimeria necatrix]CDJ66987.1 hypothetical protein ENH_00028320 [Eimeria necatrix]